MPLGVLMLDTRFTRFVGEIGNPQSYSEPVLFEVVRGATVDKVVPAKAPPLLDDFIAAGERLIARGADRDHHRLRISGAEPDGAGVAAQCAGRDEFIAADPVAAQVAAEGQAARRADILGRRSDARALCGGGCAGRYAVRRRGAGRRVPERDLREALQRQRRGARRGSRGGGAAAARAAQGHRRDPVRMHEFPAAPRRRREGDRPAGL